MKQKLTSVLSRLKKEVFALKQFLLIGLCVVAVAGTAIALNSTKEGLIEYIGAQRDIFKTGKANSVISLESLANRPGLFAVGPIDGLDGEITIFDSKPYITKVRGSDYVMDNTFKHGAFFLVWTEQTKWQDVPVPANCKGLRGPAAVRQGAGTGSRDRCYKAVSVPACRHAGRDQMAHQCRPDGRQTHYE